MPVVSFRSFRRLTLSAASMAILFSATSLTPLAVPTVLAQQGDAPKSENFDAFGKDTWAPAKDCVVHELLPRDKWSLYTAPDFYTASGWTGWESGCSYSDIKAIEPKTSFSITMTCSGEGDELDSFPAVISFLDELQASVEYPDNPDAGGELLFNCTKLIAR